MSQLDLSLFEPTDFDFVNSTRRFRLGVNDYSSQILLPKLMGHLQKIAPEIRLQVVHCPLSDKDDVNDRLIAADLDLAVAVFDRIPVVEQNCFLYEDPLVVVMDRQHPLYDEAMTVEAFVGYPQIAVSMRETEPLLINALLASLGLERKVYLTTPYVATLPQIIRGSQLMAVVPLKAAELMMDQPWMGSRSFPLRLQPFSVNLVWSKNRSADAGIAWLIEQVKALEAES
ncbi:LysR substrate-binding domain-containing protein [Motiliproteus sp. MSK22-1]|uniref:LysR substrate-binding domain-containing protein n=1 Tax=Motiliproteus sp. MSK22-1 TaxID=1897630 RepID=UPI0009764507|nr:LysR substrate-binding domain-containing protein [Motiliproteus sp. MSK22-1]